MKTITEDGEVIDTVTHEVIAHTPPFFKTPWNHDTNHEANAVALTCPEPTKTQQQFANDADINNILAKFLNTGELATTGAPIYQDLEEEFDLQKKMVTAYDVELAWNALTPEQRNTLKDPQTFVAYVDHCMQTGDIEPLRELGLAKPRPQPTGDTPGGDAPPPPPPKGASEAPKTPPTGATTDTK